MGDMYPPYMNPDEEMQEEDNEDFYGNGAINGENTQPGALDQEYHVGLYQHPSHEDQLTSRCAGCE